MQTYVGCRYNGGAEHHVYVDGTDVLKVTIPGTFGDWYYLDQLGAPNQVASTPAEYLNRLRLWDHLLGLAPDAIGVTETGQIVSRQKYIMGSQVTQDEADEFLERDCKLVPVRKDCWLWMEPRNGIWVGDARSDNFLKTSGTIVPIDVRVWTTSAPPSPK